MAGAIRARALFALAAGAAATFLATAAVAQTSHTQTNRTLSQVERDRRAENARAERLRAQAEVARDTAHTLTARLSQAKRRRAAALEAASRAEQGRTEAAALSQTEALRAQSAREAFETAVIMAAYTERRLELSAVRRNIFARAVAPALFVEHSRSLAASGRAAAMSVALAQEWEILDSAQTTLAAEQTETAHLLAENRAAETRYARDAAAAERRVRQLAAEATTLRELTRRVQRAAAARRSGPSAIPAAWISPVQGGQITRGFGAQPGGAPAAQGASLRIRPGAQITAPASARVAYAGAFRSYGQVLILDMDGGYAVVLTGLDAISARVGETVAAGQVVGQMPNSDTPAPELYVEVRRNGQPIDPGRWLGTRGLAAGASTRAG